MTFLILAHLIDGPRMKTSRTRLDVRDFFGRIAVDVFGSTAHLKTWRSAFTRAFAASGVFAYTVETAIFVERFYALASECVAEIYGPIRHGDFNSMSSLRRFMACKQNIIHDLIPEQGGSVRRR
jgi:hypothetical protein